MFKENKSLYLYMFFGTVGIVLVGLGALRYQVIVSDFDFEGYLFTYLGFTLTISYIYYLEKKAGISNKITRVKIAITFALFVISSYFLYF